MSTTAFVLDASVTARWLLPDEHGPVAADAYARLRAGTLDAHAPELWLWECGNLIANGVKRNRMDPADAMLLWSVLDAVRTRVELSIFEPPQVRACLVLAIDRGLSIYDAAYLWLAKSLALPLLTDDERLIEACGRESVPRLSLEDVA